VRKGTKSEGDHGTTFCFFATGESCNLAGRELSCDTGRGKVGWEERRGKTDKLWREWLPVCFQEKGATCGTNRLPL